MLHAPLYSRTYGAIVLYKYCFYLFYCMNFVGKRHLVVLPIPNFWRKLDTVKRLAGHVSTDAFYFSEVNSYAVGNRLLASSAEGMRPKVQRVCFLVNAFTNRTASARKHRATMFFWYIQYINLLNPIVFFDTLNSVGLQGSGVHARHVTVYARVLVVLCKWEK